MKKGMAKFTAFCLAAGMTLGEGGVAYFASPAVTLVGAGAAEKTTAKIQESADEAADTESADETESTDAAVSASAEDTQTGTDDAATEEQEDVVQPQTEALDTSMVGTTGFAQCETYLTVRASGDTEGEVVGKIYNNGSMEILDVDENGWYYVRSGNVEGYVAGQFVATGENATQIASTSGYTTAEVGAQVLNVRSEASTDSEIVGTVSESAEVEVVEDQGDWVKVVLSDGTYGYVSHDYVNTSTAYATGETIEEEQQRLDEQWLAYLAEQEAAAAAYSESDTDSDYTETSSSYADYTVQESYDAAYDASAAQAAADQAQAVADQAYAQAQEAVQAAQSAASTDTSDLTATAQSLYAVYVAAQDAADAAVANGASEQEVNDTCAAAQSAYASYVQAQNAADEAAAGITSSQEIAQAAQEAADAAQAAADAAAQEAANAQAAASEASYNEISYSDSSYDTGVETEAAYEETNSAQSTVSSAGQSVADYAVQFVGNPYVWGGASLTSGADCSGFTMAVYANFGISLPHNAAEQSGYGTAVNLDSLQPGDLVFYGDGISHVAIYIGGGQVVHASNPTNGITISSYNYRTPVCARRYL